MNDVRGEAIRVIDEAEDKIASEADMIATLRSELAVMRECAMLGYGALCALGVNLHGAGEVARRMESLLFPTVEGMPDASDSPERT